MCKQMKGIPCGQNKDKGNGIWSLVWSLLCDIAQQQDETDAYQATDDDGVSPSS